MRNVARFFAFLVAFVIAGASFARAQETPLIGSLDCQVTLGELAAEVIAQPYRKLRCLYLPLHGYPPGFQDLIGSLSPKGPPPLGRRAVWGVYSLHPYSTLPGTYARRTGTSMLAGGIATELHPIPDVPGEEVGPNLAIGATGLTLTLQ